MPTGIFPRKRNLKQCICEWCHKEFETWPSRPGRFCSLTCAGKYGARQPKPNLRKPETMKIERLCEVCENPFTTNIYQITLRGGGKYCSRKCKGEATSKRLLIDGGPNYKGGVSKNCSTFYGGNWESQKRKALKRDNYSCQICGKKKVFGDVYSQIDVHHIKTILSFKGDFESANQISNLITLCRSHHKQVEAGTLPCPKPRL